MNSIGYWLFHCHIEFHVEVGMATVFKIGEDEDMMPPPPGFPKCGNYNGKGLVSFLYPEDVELKHENLNVYHYSVISKKNDSRINMITTLDKWWPFVGGAHPYVSSSANICTPYFSILLYIVILFIY